MMRTGILTRSSQGGACDNANALRFEDKSGEEQLWLHAEKDQLTEVEHEADGPHACACGAALPPEGAVRPP